jgi:hypothetical protein
MSSFDDAIRQHLDLKRRHGADPRELAELERDALGSDLAMIPCESSHDSRSTWNDDQTDIVDWADGHRLEARRSGLSQETVEIDMEAIIEAGRIEQPQRHVSSHRRAYDWSVEILAPDIVDPASNFEWETPPRMRLRRAA